ncbi:MAG: PD40 domain-containing protein, partial [Rhodothermia bacterium]|nr:PD40 domain-containing protein [Rhodothermia bacterium]
EQSSGSEILWVDLEGRELEKMPLESARYDIPVISPDGTRLAVERFNEGEQQWDIYIYDLEDATPLRLSFSGRSENPEWGPDGRSLYYDGTRDGKRVLIKKAADGSGTEQIITTEQAPATAPVVSPDGNTILYYAAGEGGMDLFALNLQTSETSVAATGADWQTDAWFSPTGQFFVYETQETGSSQIYVRQLGGDAYWEISEGSGSFGDPMWTGDGEHIYFENNGRRLMRVRVATEPTFRRLGRPEIVAEFDTDIDFALHPDGERILILSNQMGGVEVNNGLQVVQNWFEEVKRMAPAGK